jgi:hypothetical protein
MQSEVREIVVESNIPFTKFVRYVPVQWSTYHYEEYFEVTRHIEAEEMNFSIKNNATGKFLLPYALHCKQYGWTRAQYQALLDEMLPVGASFHYVKSEPGFWDEFFSLLGDISSAVQEAFAEAKSAVISFVVDNIPLIGDDARDLLKKAASYAVDYGLMYIGIPPSLPNLDVLAEGGIDYCLEYAVAETLKQAGIPADSVIAEEMSAEVRSELSERIAAELKARMEAMQQNPFNVEFLRISTSAQYRPAYIDVTVANYSDDDYSVPGSLYMSFDNGHSVYDSECLYIPSLAPKDFVKIRVYLKHQRGKYAGYEQYFDELYNGSEGIEMRVTTWYTLPDVKDAARAQGLSPAPLPYVTEYVYDRQDYEYIRNFVPAVAILQDDDSVNPVDFFD